MHEYQPAKHYKISREEILYFFPNYEDNNISKYEYIPLFLFSSLLCFQGVLPSRFCGSPHKDACVATLTV